MVNASEQKTPVVVIGGSAGSLQPLRQIIAGLPPDLAMRLARATVSGAGELLHRDPASAATLRQNVTSPGGTTAAALAILMADDGMKPLFARAVAAATRRSRELAG